MHTPVFGSMLLNATVQVCMYHGNNKTIGDNQRAIDETYEKKEQKSY